MYEIHNNGSRPFSVQVAKAKATLFTNTMDDDGKSTLEKHMELPFKKIWLGEPAPDQDYEKGSTILLQRASDYVLITAAPFSFKLPEAVVHFHNPIGNNDVPYPYIIGTDHIFFLVSTKGLQYAPKEDFDLTGDVYYELYQRNKVKPLPTIPTKRL